jgi:hypothetical protein
VTDRQQFERKNHNGPTKDAIKSTDVNFEHRNPRSHLRVISAAVPGGQKGLRSESSRPGSSLMRFDRAFRRRNTLVLRHSREWPGVSRVSGEGSNPVLGGTLQI